MAGGGRPSLILVAASLLECLVVAAAATTHTVGGSFGWSIPSPNTSFYSDWASEQVFAVGDTLAFDFATGAHDVIRVPKASYDSCSTSNQIGSTITTGPASVTITSADDHYFICGFSSHCNLGQKLAITVASSPSTTTGSPPPSTTANGGPTASVPGAASSLPSGVLRIAVTSSLVVLSFASYYLL